MSELINDIANWILTLLLIGAIIYAGNQRFFETAHCKQICTEKFSEFEVRYKYNDGNITTQNFSVTPAKWEEIWNKTS